jgi:hypothetical protein
VALFKAAEEIGSVSPDGPVGSSHDDHGLKVQQLISSNPYWQLVFHHRRDI